MDICHGGTGHVYRQEWEIGARLASAALAAKEVKTMNFPRILSNRPVAALRRFAGPPCNERVRREWFAYFGAFGDDFFGDDD